MTSLLTIARKRITDNWNGFLCLWGLGYVYNYLDGYGKYKENVNSNILKFYSVCIVICLSHLPYLTILNMIRDWHPSGIPRVCFELIPVSQYICSVYYIQKPHFYQFYKDYIKKEPIILNLFNLTVVHSVIVCIIGTVLLGVTCGLDEAVCDRRLIPSIIARSFYGFYAGPILLINGRLFNLMMTFHKSQLEQLYKKVSGKDMYYQNVSSSSNHGGGHLSFLLSNRSSETLKTHFPPEDTSTEERIIETVDTRNVDFVMDTGNNTDTSTMEDEELSRDIPESPVYDLELAIRDEWIELNQIILEIHDFRYGLEYSIDSLGDMFSINTIIGSFGVGGMIYRKCEDIKNGNNIFNLLHSPYVFICAIGWILIQLQYLKTVRGVSNCREGIQKRLRTPFYTQLYLCHGNVNTIGKDTITTLDWLVLREILSDKWCEFKVLGLSLSDTEGIKQALMFGSFIIASLEMLK